MEWYIATKRTRPSRKIYRRVLKLAIESDSNTKKIGATKPGATFIPPVWDAPTIKLTI